MKTTVYPSPLAARCAAQNAVNAEANRLSALTIDVLRPYVGRKVIKTTDRRFVAAVGALLPAANPDVQMWLAHSDRGLCFALKTHRCTQHNDASGGCQIAHYAEAYFYAGEVDAAGTLIKVSEPVNLPADYTPEAITEARKVAETAREAARKAESACGPFGLYDR